MAKQKRKRRRSTKATPDRRKFVNFFLDVLANVIAAILADLIAELFGL